MNLKELFTPCLKAIQDSKLGEARKICSDFIEQLDEQDRNSGCIYWLSKLINAEFSKPEHAKSLLIPLFEALVNFEDEHNLQNDSSSIFSKNLGIVLRRAIAFGYHDFVEFILNFDNYYSAVASDILIEIFHQKTSKDESIWDLVENNTKERPYVLITLFLIQFHEKRIGIVEDVRHKKIVDKITLFHEQEQFTFCHNLMVVLNASDHFVLPFINRYLSLGKLLTHRFEFTLDFNQPLSRVTLYTEKLTYKGDKLKRIRFLCNKGASLVRAFFEITIINNKKSFIRLPVEFIETVFHYLRIHGINSEYLLNVDKPLFALWRDNPIIKIYQTSFQPGLNFDYVYTNIHKNAAVQLISEKSLINEMIVLYDVGCGNGEGLLWAKQQLVKIGAKRVIVFGCDINAENIATAKLLFKNEQDYFFEICDFFNKNSLTLFFNRAAEKIQETHVALAMTQGVLNKDVTEVYTALSLVQQIYRQLKPRSSQLFLQVAGMRNLILDTQTFKKIGFKVQDAMSLDKQGLRNLQDYANPILLLSAQSEDERARHLQKRCNKIWDLSESADLLADIKILRKNNALWPAVIDCCWSALDDNQVAQFLDDLKGTQVTLVYSGKESWSKPLETQAPTKGITLQKKLGFKLTPISPAFLKRFQTLIN